MPVLKFLTFRIILSFPDKIPVSFGENPARNFLFTVFPAWNLEVPGFPAGKCVIMLYLTLLDGIRLRFPGFSALGKS